MLTQGITACQRVSRPPRALALIAAVAAVLLGLPARAADLPPPDRSLDAHARVRGWVRAWAVPQEASDLPAVWGAGVTLRLDGRVIARGSAMARGEASSEPIRAAAAQAVREARPKLPVPNDALADENLAGVGRQVTVSLEFYARPVPIPDAELGLPFAGCSPGAEALVVSLVRDGAEPVTLVSGVDSQLTRGVDPARDLSALATEITGDGATALRPLPELAAQGFRFERAAVVHLAMPHADAAPVFLDRGARVVGAEEIRFAALTEMADGLAAHLRSRVWPGVERYGLGGDLRVVTGAADPVAAPPFEQALAALALFRHAETAGRRGAAESRDAGVTILRDLAAVEPGEDSPWQSAPSAAMAAAALAEVDAQTLAADSELQALRARVLDTLRQAFDPVSGFTPDVPHAARGLVAWALVRAGRLDPVFTPARADAAVRAAFRDTPRGQLVAQMPFLAWAELDLHPDAEPPSAAALTETRSLVWDHQVRRADLRSIDRDLAGGVVFTRGRAVLPTWHSMRPLAAIATMLGNEHLTPGGASSGTVPGELLRLTEGLRFVRQLALTDEALFLARRPEQAAWGVRPSVWQPAASVEATALALLTTCETIDSMRAVAARSTPHGADAQP